MKKLLIYSMLLLISSGCSDEQTEPPFIIYPDGPATLMIYNQLAENYSITEWKMVGYDFMNLDIQPGNSGQFLLVNGMPGGYDDQIVTVFFSSSNNSFSISEKVSFTSYGITTIRIFGKDSVETKWNARDVADIRSGH